MPDTTRSNLAVYDRNWLQGSETLKVGVTATRQVMDSPRISMAKLFGEDFVLASFAIQAGHR